MPSSETRPWAARRPRARFGRPRPDKDEGHPGRRSFQEPAHDETDVLRIAREVVVIQDYEQLAAADGTEVGKELRQDQLS